MYDLRKEWDDVNRLMSFTDAIISLSINNLQK